MISRLNPFLAKNLYWSKDYTYQNYNVSLLGSIKRIINVLFCGCFIPIS